MDPAAFNTYTEFYLHVDSMCYYLQTEIFLERTEASIQHLYHANRYAGAMIESLNIHSSAINEQL